MLNKIIDLSIKNKLLVGLFVLALIIYGALEVTRLPIDAVPDITNNQVQIITVAPSYGATDIERLITFPIEQANSNISGLQEIRSFSRFGLSLVTIVFDDETDVYWARQQVAERLQQVRAVIPQGIGSPELAPVTTGLGEIYQYVVRPKEGYEHKYNETDLRTIQDWYVRRQLLGVEGVAEVSSFGGKLKQYEIAVDPNKLQSYQLTVEDVFGALEKNNQNTGGAYIEKGPTVLFIRSEGLIGNIADIGNISIKNNSDGTPLQIKHVAEVRTGHATRYGAMCYNQKGEVAGAVVMMLKGANSNVVIRNVKERIEKIQSTLPEGVVIEPFLDRTKMVNNAIGTVEKNLIEGALIVVFVLVLLLGNFRAGLLVASVIPLSMLFAVIMMNLFGVSGNLMSLGALDFGLIVDGAVIIVEAVMHRLAHFRNGAHSSSLTQPEMDSEVKHSAGKMMNSAVFGQIIILVVYLPIFSLQGIEGKMFKPMAQTVAFALAGAFILSLTYVPMMSALVLSRKTGHAPNFSDRMMDLIGKRYQGLLLRVLKIPKLTLTIVLALFALSIALLMSLGGEFIPALEEGDFAVETRMLTGSNLNTTIDNSQKAAGILLKRFPEIEKIVTKIGSGEVPTDPMPMEAGDMMVILKDKSEWTSAETFNELSEKMGKAVEEVPGITTSFQYPVQMRFNELMTGARQDVVCKIFGEDLDTLALYAAKLGEIAKGVQGTDGLYVETVTGMPQVIVRYDREAIAQYGISISDINRVVNMAFAGASTGMVFEGEKRFDLVVRLKGEKRDHLEDIRNLLIPVPSGAQIPLYQLAEVDIKQGPYQIQREDAKRRIIIGFNVRGRDVQSIVKELQDKVNKQIKFSSGYYVNYGGAFENLNEAKKRLSIAVPVSLVLIFILLYFAFHSVKHGLLIYSAIPLSAIGGIFFLAVRGMPFSISAGVGFIALFGIAVLNGIVLIAEFNRLRAEGATDLQDIVVKGTGVRLRPVLMTALVASLGFLPMAISNGAGAEVQRPLATVVIGGLMIATLLTLFVLPVLYVMFERSGRRRPGNKIIAVIVFMVLSQFSHAQQKLSLNAALDSAVKNNLTLRNEQVNAEMRKKLIGTYAEIPKTGVGAEFGQINSAYADNRISVSQAFSFPAVYARNRKVLTEEWRSALLQVSYKEAEIRRAVSYVYNELSCLLQKKALLQQTDSIFAEFAVRAEKRVKVGESSVLELTTAQTQRGQIAVQLQDLDNEIVNSGERLRILMNTAKIYWPEQDYLPWNADLNSDSSQLRSHPLLKYYDQQKVVAGRRVAAQKAGFLPEFSIGYSNMSMIGTGADNITYGRSSRFQSVQVGIGLPLFFGSQRSRLNTTKLESLVTENTYSLEAKQMQAEYAYALSRYKAGKASLNYFETTGLKNAETIRAVADKQLRSGEINYIEWVMLIHQATAIYSDHLETLRKYNESVIQINYLSTKK